MGEDEEKRKLPSEIKLFDPNSPLFDVYLAMEENFCCKFGVALAMTPHQQPTRPTPISRVRDLQGKKDLE